MHHSSRILRGPTSPACHVGEVAAEVQIRTTLAHAKIAGLLAPLIGRVAAAPALRRRIRHAPSSAKTRDGVVFARRRRARGGVCVAAFLALLLLFLALGCRCIPLALVKQDMALVLAALARRLRRRRRGR
jgi:hypothetical protein